MKKYILADFHIHSHFSMATSKNLSPEHLDFWARRKGINIIGSGDISHPGWLAELKQKLRETEPGLYQLKPALRLPVEDAFQDSEVRFILTGEISSIYKHKGKTRKIHNIFFLPDFQTAARFQANLEKRQVNIRSDGRPICGLSAHDLLELALNTDDRIFCVPAHIWTPWFSLFGAKSGYDAIEECFEDLTPRITTLETGLSADVPMIRLISVLDKYSLISSSDAHSPGKLGRNATLLAAEYNWQSIINAMKTGDTQTIDMYPQAGKYHYDGHRKCQICWHPRETSQHAGICPICGKPVTIGVLNRVYQLADRSEIPPDLTKNWQFIMPLPEIISRITGVGEKSKKVITRYDLTLAKGLSEMQILLNDPTDTENLICDPDITGFLQRFHSGSLKLNPGYDGEYGNIHLL
ncbi:MAG: endonuclease Q family protein [Candidatus Cloacimonetes bacterium]|nr:endonuclease Q family protein [Candidatus Cloacimonadota bacterium]